MRLIRTLALALLASSGCADPTEPSPPPGVQIRAAVTGAAFADYPLLVDVTVRNASRTVYSVSGSAGRCVGMVEVVDALGERARFGDYRVCDAALARHPLVPGAELTDRPQVPGLPAGAYRMRAGVSIVGHGLVWSEFVPIVVRAR
jgi:hypothetical protein